MTSRETYDTRGARNFAHAEQTMTTHRRANAINDASSRSEPAMTANKLRTTIPDTIAREIHIVCIFSNVYFQSLSIKVKYPKIQTI